MSRALPPNPAHRLPHTNMSSTSQQEQKQQEYSAQHHHYQAKNDFQHHQIYQQQNRNSSNMHRHRMPSTSDSQRPIRLLNSPLDFTDSIPFNELSLSTETLGSGSFGTVFKGRWRGVTVAVKQYKTREQIDSFTVEVKQLSSVKHQNIVRLYGTSSPSKIAAYLVMEYAEGGSLNHLLHESRQQEYDLRHACSWAMQTARGVSYLHSLTPKPIMHRDLKPANLLLFSRGKILKICDFGTACAVKTQMTNNTGSASYMAPEVFATSNYLESGDVYSWGIIFWEILTRMQPYKQSSNPFQILWKVTQGARPREIEDCPEIIWKLITRSWDKDPNERPKMRQVAQEMGLIFELARKSDNGAESATDTRSLPRSPEEVTTPTNNDIGSSINDFSKQMHIRCRQSLKKLLPFAGQRRQSSPAQSAVVQSPEKLPVGSSDDQHKHQVMASRQDSKPPVNEQMITNKPQNSPDTRLKVVEQQQQQQQQQLQQSQPQHRQQHRKVRHFEHSQYSHMSSSSCSSSCHSNTSVKHTDSNKKQQHQHQTSDSASIYSQRQSTANNRMRALTKHIQMLQERYFEIQKQLECDQKNSECESFLEYESLKKT